MSMGSATMVGGVWGAGLRAMWRYLRVAMFGLLVAAAAPRMGVAQVAKSAATAADYRKWQQEIREALFIPAALPELKVTSYGSFAAAQGVVAERVTYTTLYGLRVPAIVYRPAKTGARRPAMVIVNGHAGDKTSWYAFYAGVLYARAGAVVLTYDPIGEDERNVDRKSETRAHDTVVRGAEMPARLGGLMVTDVLQAVNYLAQRQDVDRERIAVAAYSMGTFHS